MGTSVARSVLPAQVAGRIEGAIIGRNRESDMYRILFSMRQTRRYRRSAWGSGCASNKALRV